MISNLNLLSKFTLDFCNVVDKYSKYVILSGFVAIATGRPRGTEDIDILVEKLDFETFNKIHLELLEKFEVLGLSDINSKSLYDEYLSQNIPIRYIYKNKLFPNMEFKFCKNLVDDLTLKNRQKIIETNLDIYFPQIEMQIAYKETILTSQKDLEDSIHLRTIFKDKINENKIKEYSKLCKEVLLK